MLGAAIRGRKSGHSRRRAWEVGAIAADVGHAAAADVAGCDGFHQLGHLNVSARWFQKVTDAAMLSCPAPSGDDIVLRWNCFFTTTIAAAPWSVTPV